MNTNKSIKILISFVVILCLIFSMTTTANAGRLERTYRGSFDDDWSMSAEEKAYSSIGVPFVVRLSYGFNTFLFNEDCATSYTDGTYHHASVCNANGTHNGPRMRANEFSDIQVRHKGSVISYASVYELY